MKLITFSLNASPSYPDISVEIPDNFLEVLEINDYTKLYDKFNSFLEEAGFNTLYDFNNLPHYDKRKILYGDVYYTAILDFCKEYNFKVVIPIKYKYTGSYIIDCNNSRNEIVEQLIKEAADFEESLFKKAYNKLIEFNRTIYGNYSDAGF